MPIHLDEEFWRKEKDKLWAVVGPVLAALIIEGARTGESLLPLDLQVLINWDLFDERVLNALTKLRSTWWDSISNTTRKRATAQIEDWLRSGERIPDLERRFVSNNIFSAERAGKIAVTEVTRAVSRGNTEIWSSTGFIRQGVWHTANDEKVCELCESLDGTHWDIEDTDTHPPAHVWCRCWLIPIVDEEMVRNMIRGILEKAG